MGARGDQVNEWNKFKNTQASSAPLRHAFVGVMYMCCFISTPIPYLNVLKIREFQSCFSSVKDPKRCVSFNLDLDSPCTVTLFLI